MYFKNLRKREITGSFKKPIFCCPLSMWPQIKKKATKPQHIRILQQS